MDNPKTWKWTLKEALLPCLTEHTGYGDNNVDIDADDDTAITVYVPVLT